MEGHVALTRRITLNHPSTAAMRLMANYFDEKKLRRVLEIVARFNDVHAFGYNSAGSERIWTKFGELRSYCLELALTDFGRDPRRSESGSASRFFVFLFGKYRTTLPISSRPNFTKFAHKTWFCDVVNPFGMKFSISGVVFSQNPLPRERLPTSCGDITP